MNAERLLQHFDRLSEAPDAIPRLRQFVLELAVRGKLVPQDPYDEPASELLKRIRAEKERLVKEGKIKKEKLIQSRTKSGMPAELPKGWLWTSIQEVCTSVTDGDHLPPPKSESGIPFLVIGNVRSQSIEFDGCRHVLDSYYQQLDEIRRPSRGDVLYTLVGSYGIPVVVRDARPFCVQRHIGILRPSQYADVDFLERVLESKVVFDQATQCATGIAQKTVPLAGLRGILIPIPPLAEQHRIVAKVDELMALCDQLEAAKTQCEQSRDRLVAASLHRLNQPADAEEANTPGALRDHAQFIFNHLPCLTTRPEHIKQLRQTILNLAVRGKLVPQDPNDEPALELLKRIEKEKAKLVKEGKIRKSQPLAALSREELPFDLPQQWDWIKLGNIGFAQTGTTPPTSKPECFGDFIPFVKPADLTGNAINYAGEGLSETGIQHSRLIPNKSVLMVCIGSSIGKVNVTDREVCCNQQINTVTPYLDGSTAFTSFALRGSYFQELVLKNAGMGTLPIISKGKWEQLPIPVPPLTEQHSIVAKVDELMAVCDQLEAQLTTSEADSRRLLEAVLHEALALEEPA